MRLRDPRPVGLLLIVLTAAACGAGGVSSSPSAGSSATRPTASASAVGSGAASSSVAADQTETDWGRIWDTLPDRFPIYPSAARSDEAQTAPSSGVYVVAGKKPTLVTAWYENALQAASYSTEKPSGPLEDGSYTLDATGAAGCRIELTIAPLGGLTSVTIMYGAACRH